MLEIDRIRLARLPLPAGDGVRIVRRPDPENLRRWAGFNPAQPNIDPAFFSKESFQNLDEPVQSALEVVLRLVPARAPDVERLIGLSAFTELSPDEQRALLSPPKPDRLDHALGMLEHPLWPWLRGDKVALFDRDERTQRAVLDQFQHFAQKRTAEALIKLVGASWLPALEVDDQIRAVKVIAYLSAHLAGVCDQQNEIVKNTLDALLSGRFKLEFADLAFEEHDTVLGLRHLPDTLVLNRNAIRANERKIEEYPEDRTALATVVHEINHLVNGIPEGPTYAAFQDEYRAWYVGFVAFMSRLPTKKEALGRCQLLLSSPEYPDIQQGLASESAESEQIFAFMRKFGDVRTKEDFLALDLDNYVLSAPFPDPELNMTNA